MPQNNLSKINTRLQGLDSLRGMAALAVVLYHYTFGYTQVVGRHIPGLDLIATNGHFGIYLFFIISGFVIFMTLERSARAADFSVSRFARLWPPYLVCAGLTSLLIVGLDFNPNHLTVGDALLNILMMNKVLGNVSIDPSYWTLTYEVLFYAGAAMIFFWLKVKRIEWACLAWLGLAFVARISSFNDHHQRLGVLLGVDFCHFFVLGMMIYLISQRRSYVAHMADGNGGFFDDPFWACLQSRRHEAVAVHPADRTVCGGCVVGCREKDTLSQHCTVALFWERSRTRFTWCIRSQGIG